MREIKPFNNNGSIQLKFSYGSKRYSFNPIPGGDYSNKRDLQTAKAIAVKIQNDILAGCLDPTLQKYRLAPKTTPELTKPNNLLELWDLWVNTLDLSAATKADHYEWVRRMILKANPSLTDTTWFTQAPLAAVTYNDRLSYLKSFGKWAAKQGLVNSFESLKSRKKPFKEVKPFSISETALIVKGFEDQAPHYVPFVRFLFLTGVRISEAIGLRWNRIDFKRNELTISESLSKDVTGNGYQRIRKETKTGSVRHLTLSPELRSLLLTLRPSEVKPECLVFTTVKGCVIDADNFRERHWVKVLAACDIPYRKLHAIRHTTLSYAVEQGTSLTGVAYLAGHKNTRMVIQTYGHIVNRPSLPKMPV